MASCLSPISLSLFNEIDSIAETRKRHDARLKVLKKYFIVKHGPRENDINLFPPETEWGSFIKEIAIESSQKRIAFFRSTKAAWQAVLEYARREGGVLGDEMRWASSSFAPAVYSMSAWHRKHGHEWHLSRRQRFFSTPCWDDDRSHRSACRSCLTWLLAWCRWADKPITRDPNPPNL